MAYKITSQCISCDRCLSVCPTGAIKQVNGLTKIEPSICTECIGTAYTVPQCAAVCPTHNGCVKEITDYWEMWFATYNRTTARLGKKQDYWESWFNLYARTFSSKLSRHQQEVLEA